MLVGFGLGVLAAFFWAMTNIVDKYLVAKYSSNGNVGGVLLLSCFFPILLVILAFFFTDAPFAIPATDAYILLLSGGLMVGWLFFYLKALTEDDASVVMTLLVLAPLFSLLFANIILHELPTNIQLLGGALIVSGALSVSYSPSLKIFKWKLLAYAILASAMAGLLFSLFKFVTIDESFWQSIFWRSAGTISIGLILYVVFKSYRESFHTFVRQHLMKGLGLNTANETLTLVGDTIFAFAILFAPLALVQTTEGFQPIFIFIMILVLSKFGFTAVTEETTERLRYKFLGISLVLLGSITLTYFG